MGRLSVPMGVASIVCVCVCVCGQLSFINCLTAWLTSKHIPLAVVSLV